MIANCERVLLRLFESGALLAVGARATSPSDTTKIITLRRPSTDIGSPTTYITCASIVPTIRHAIPTAIGTRTVR